MVKKRGLGKGISALIPDVQEAIPDKKGGLLQVRIEEITTNPFQPRKEFSETNIEELSSSIKEKGILQPLIVTKSESGYELIAGERRLRAALKAGILTVPVTVRTSDEKERQEIALIENIQREDLNVIEVAEGCQRLIERFDSTQEEIAKRLGKSRSVITNILRLLRLSRNIKEALRQKKIFMGHARAYLSLESTAKQKEAHKIVVKKRLSVRQTETLTKKMGAASTKSKTGKPDTGIEKTQNAFIADDLKKRFSTKVNILRKGEKGKVVIEFYSNEDFERIYDLLRGYST